MSEVYGCDIGNGMGYISLYSQKTGIRPMLPDDIRLDGMPSQGYLNNGGGIDVYNDIREGLRSTHPGRVLDAAKSRLDLEEIVQMDGNKKVVIRPADVVSAVIRKLVELANERRKSVRQEPIYDVVLTYPAKFDGSRELLGRLRNSVEKTSIDGKNLQVRGMLPEPSAAAIAYLKESGLKEGQTSTVLVYDLGHGTFDTALVSAALVKGTFQTTLLNDDGIKELGGKNLNEILYKMAIGKLEQQGVAMNRLSDQEAVRREIPALKHGLSSSESQQFGMVVAGDVYEVSFSRKEFEHEIQGLIGQTMEKTLEMLNYAREAGHKIDMVVMTGGGSRIPLVSQYMNMLLTDTGIKSVIYKPGSAVSYGAAIYAAGLPVQKIVPHGYGVQVSDPVPGDAPVKGALKIMVPRGAKRPAESSELDYDYPLFPMTVRIMRTRPDVEQELSSKTGALVSVERCEDVQRFNFDLIGKVRIMLSLDDSGGISVTVKNSEGSVLQQGTFH